MIEMRYHPPSAGAQISFLVADEERTSGCNLALNALRDADCGGKMAPQTKRNLEVLKSIVEMLIERAE